MMFAASLPVLVLCTCCTSPTVARQTFLGVQNSGSNAHDFDVNSDNANTDQNANRDVWESKSNAIESAVQATERIQEAEQERPKAPSNPSAAPTVNFVEPGPAAPPPKTWNDLTPAQKKALQQKYVASQYFQSFFTWILWTILGVLVGIFAYTQKTVEPDEKISPADDGGPEYEFQNGHCACLEDLESCACACLCPALRWADTLNQAGFSKFWLAFLLYTILALLNCLHWGKMWAGIFTALGICVMRQRLRAKVGLIAWDFRGCCLDCCFSFWCPCCAIAQEARVVQAMQRCGHESLEQDNSES